MLSIVCLCVCVGVWFTNALLGVDMLFDCTERSTDTPRKGEALLSDEEDQVAELRFYAFNTVSMVLEIGPDPPRTPSTLPSTPRPASPSLTSKRVSCLR
jgi:hypothetical protein